MADGRLSLFQQKSLFLDHDALIIEGYKSLDSDKIVLIDAESRIFSAIDSWDRVQAFVGADASAPAHLPVDRPYFQRDAIEAVAAFVQDLWLKKARDSRPLHGLVLAGGQSSRMGEDKGRMRYRGETQALRCLRLLKGLGLPSFLSIRDGQWPEAETRDLPVLYDQFENAGPLCGMLTAMQRFPEASWLVVACDLPLLGADVLENLLQGRKIQKMATAYRSSEEPDFPEPLCAIYENSIRMRFYEALALGMACPRKVLLQSNTALLEPIDPLALTNVNNPDEARKIRARLQESL
jgi:molybdopterin-guanine dinucleotide biosynthesis protein A